MIFDKAIHYSKLPESISNLKEYLNYNPPHNEYTRKQNIAERNPNETDRGGWRGYDRVYSKYFRELSKEKMNILEIGIMHGYGILAWNRFFTNSNVYGVDINHNTTMLVELMKIENDFPWFVRNNLKFFDTTKADDWLEFYGKTFDIIIDDGGHHPKTQIETFKNAWNYLKKGGLYFIEDISHRYGEDELRELSDCLLSYEKEFDFIEVYAHNNDGLKKVFKDRPNLNVEEYITAIKKKV